MSKQADNATIETPFDPIEDLIAAIRDGASVIVVDDERRENEGDLICASAHASADLINFMVTHGRGLVCVALDRSDVDRFGLNRMPTNLYGGSRYGTAFTDSVDAAEGITTGISAEDRARTVQVLIDPTSNSADLVKPGHLFPLESHPRGVIGRPGHTEAAVDLARLGGLHPSGVICEILKEDGSMARLPDLITFARAHGLKLGSIQDLILYRQRTETLVHCDRTVNMPTEYGVFKLHSFWCEADQDHHLALVMGEPEAQDAALVRVHSECLTGDVLGSQRCDCGVQLNRAMQMVAEAGHGAVLYMRQEGRGIGLGPKLHAYALQDQGMDTVEANEKLGFKADMREYASAAQILRALGIERLNLITNNPEKIRGLESFGIEIADRIPCVTEANVHNERYLQTKRDKLGHLL